MEGLDYKIQTKSKSDPGEKTVIMLAASVRRHKLNYQTLNWQTNLYSGSKRHTQKVPLYCPGGPEAWTVMAYFMMRTKRRLLRPNRPTTGSRKNQLYGSPFGQAGQSSESSIKENTKKGAWKEEALDDLL